MKKILIFTIMLFLTLNVIAFEKVGIGQEVNIEVKKYIAPELEVDPNCSTTTCVQDETVSGDLFDREEINIEVNGTDFIIISSEEISPNNILLRFMVVILLLVIAIIIWKRKKRKNKKEKKEEIN